MIKLPGTNTSRINARSNIIISVFAIGLTAFPAILKADTQGLIEIADTRAINELWLNPGFYSYHYQKDVTLNGNNYGLGGEYRYSTVSSVTLGFFDNSDNQISRYLGWYWQPIQLRSLRLGAVIGAINGYPKMMNGGWFLAAIPTASIDYKRVGANIMFVPGYRNRLYGAISFQIKLRVY